MRPTLALFLTGAAALLMTGGRLAAQTDPEPDPDPRAGCDEASARPAWEEGTTYKEGDAIISRGGNLVVCKGGAATAKCGLRGFEPDIDNGAADAWDFIKRCQFPETAEPQTTNVAISNIKCQGTIAVVTLTATIQNNSPFSGKTKVAFYHSAKKTLIASEEFVIPEDYGVGEISTVWRTPAVGPVLITAVANDDGTGRKVAFEYSDGDNSFDAKLMTCPIPKPSPGPVPPPP